MSFSMFSADFKVESGNGGQFLNIPTEDGKFIRFAVLGAVVSGYRYWTQENRPKNLKVKPNGRPADIRTGGKYEDRVKQFIACPVLDYEEGTVRVFICENAKVINAIHDLVQNDVVDPMSQYFRISRTKVGAKSEYNVNGVVFKPGVAPAPTPEQYAEAAALDMEDILFRVEEPKAETDEVDASVDVAKAAQIM